MTARRGPSPRQRIEEECSRRGRAAFVTGCVDLLQGRDVDTGLITVLGGPATGWALAGESEERDLWLRVWAVRGLLWAWDDTALAPLVAALDDDAWRVREMALKVVSRHRLDDALEHAVMLRETDGSARVRAAADRALIRLAQQ
jgi:hypothetical protein